MRNRRLRKAVGLWAGAKPISPGDWWATTRTKSYLLPRGVKIVPNGVGIVAVLPISEGKDPGAEQGTIANSTTEPADLDGQQLIDKAGNVFLVSDSVQPTGFWGALILYGLNAVTYEVALGNTLLNLAERGERRVSWEDLSQEFFQPYVIHLSIDKPMP